VPMTIYEALAVRTPLICSDHPAYAGRVGAGTASIAVPERSPAAIADAADRLFADPDRYHLMSEATATTWKKLGCPVSYYELIRRWATGSPEDEQWLAAHHFVCGDRFTMADVYVGSAIDWGLAFKTIPERPAFAGYAERFRSRDAYRDAKAIDTRLIEEMRVHG